MTDSEIIKALEHCSGKKGCKTCPVYNAVKMGESCIIYLMQHAHNIIHRQKAEIAVLTAERDNYKEWYLLTVEDIEKTKSEALNEFADKLKNCLHTDDFGTPDERWKPESDFAYIIDCLAKGILEDSNETRTN